MYNDKPPTLYWTNFCAGSCHVTEVVAHREIPRTHMSECMHIKLASNPGRSQSLVREAGIEANINWYSCTALVVFKCLLLCNNTCV